MISGGFYVTVTNGRRVGSLLAEATALGEILHFEVTYGRVMRNLFSIRDGSCDQSQSKSYKLRLEGEWNYFSLSKLFILYYGLSSYHVKSNF